MLFLPLKADLVHLRFPFVTVLVMLLCLGIYHGQHRNLQQVVDRSIDFCEQPAPTLWRMVMQKIGRDSSPAGCLELMQELRLASDREALLDELAASGAPMAGLTGDSDRAFKRQTLAARFQAFDRAVPVFDTQQLWYRPDSWDPWHMITAAFAHGSWMHVIGNLVFFFAFAASVEVFLGSLLFGLTLVGLALGTHVFYSLAMLGVADPPPTVGLSGVVMGMMALFAFFLPDGRIKCLLWFLLIVRFIGVPAWLLVLWYAGWDVYTLLSGADHQGINLVAHVSGAGLGYLAGVLFFRERRQEVRAGVAA